MFSGYVYGCEIEGVPPTDDPEPLDRGRISLAVMDSGVRSTQQPTVRKRYKHPGVRLDSSVFHGRSEGHASILKDIATSGQV